MPAEKIVMKSRDSDTNTGADEATKAKASASASASDTDLDTDAEVSTENENAQMLMGLMADPDIRAILAARQQGQSTKVTIDEASKTSAAAAAAAEVEEDLEDLDPEVKKLIRLFDRKINAQVKPLTDKLAGLESLAQTFQRQAVNGQIKSTSVKHPDFNKYRKKMAAIARETSGLSVEEIYYIAKHRAGELKSAEPSTHSERPTPTPRRRTSGERESTESLEKRGRRAFQSILADALDNIETAPET